jgi:sulfite reductase (NADPH) flavoprotein alpha-component
MIKWVIYRLHWLLGISVGVVLSIMGVTGALMAFEDEIMTSVSHGIVDVPVRTADPLMPPDELLARFIAQSPDSLPIKLTLFPEAGKAARLVYRPRATQSMVTDEDNSDGTFLNPYTGAVLGKAVGERFFDAVRSMHRYLLLPHNKAGAGRPLTTFAAACLVFFALSGLYLRWPRRALDWRAWLKPDLRRRGRNLYWSLHSVAGTWLFVIFLVFAITGPTFAYDAYRDDLTALLTWTPLPAAKPPAGDPQKPTSPARLDAVWSGFQAAAPTDVTTVLFPISLKATRTVTIRYLIRSSPHYRAYNEITLDRNSGAVLSHRLYARQSWGKRLSIGMLAVHRGKVFGVVGAFVFMLAALMVPLFCLTGYLLYLDRRRKKVDARVARLATPALSSTGGDVLIAFASQSGTAERIAWQSANELTRGGRAVRVERLAALDIPQIKRAGTVLVVASTFGSGEPPDTARAFAKRVLASPADLSGLRGGVLALGHRDYPDFCGFGRMLEHWLHSSGVESLFPRIEMHADDPAALASWRQHLRGLGAIAEPDESWQTPTTQQPWRLLERILVNPGNSAAEAYHLVLEPQPPAAATWTAGDVAVITPRRQGAEAETLLTGSKEAPTREYSISSIPTGGTLELLVRKTVLSDGQLGLGSGWLTQHAALGELVHLRIRSNPGFHPPATPGPMILIGAGTGLAGLRAHLLHRQHNGLRGAWLVFGERSSRTDRPHGEQIESWVSDGTLSRCDLVFSRDSTRRQYVQHRLEELASELLAWVRHDGATIFVCGGLKMGQAVHTVLQNILGESHLDELAAGGRYRRDVY